MGKLVVRLSGLAIVLVVFALPVGLQAQQTGLVPRIGVLTGAAPGPLTPWSAFREGLRALGYVEGQNVAIEWRWTDGKPERLPALAAELVRLNVNVIVASDNPAITASRDASRTVPIVMVLSTDPVGTGFVASLARPGGNITGLTLQAPDWQAKALQLLKETVPHVSRVAILWDPEEPGRRALARDAEIAGAALGLQVQLLGPRSAAELAKLFTAMARHKPDAMLVQPSSMIYSQRTRIAELAAIHRLPTMGWRRETVEAGGLMAYGPVYVELFRRAAHYVDKILKGTKPTELPVQQPTTFELVVNRKTAKTLGLAIPQSVLLRADEVIH